MTVPAHLGHHNRGGDATRDDLTNTHAGELLTTIEEVARWRANAVLDAAWSSRCLTSTAMPRPQMGSRGAASPAMPKPIARVGSDTPGAPASRGGGSTRAISRRTGTQPSQAQGQPGEESSEERRVPRGQGGQAHAPLGLRQMRRGRLPDPGASRGLREAPGRLVAVRSVPRTASPGTKRRDPMTAREDLNRVIADYLARTHPGTRWRPYQPSPATNPISCVEVDGASSRATGSARLETGSRHPLPRRTTTQARTVEIHSRCSATGAASNASRRAAAAGPARASTSACAAGPLGVPQRPAVLVQLLVGERDLGRGGVVPEFAAQAHRPAHALLRDLDLALRREYVLVGQLGGEPLAEVLGLEVVGDVLLERCGGDAHRGGANTGAVLLRGAAVVAVLAGEGVHHHVPAA